MKADDYLIFKTLSEGKPPRFHLSRAVKPVTDGILVTLEEDAHIKKTQATIEAWQVVLNLGKEPEPGKVYGWDTGHVFKKTVSTDCGSDIHFFADLKSKAETRAVEGLVSAKKILKKHGLAFVTDLPVHLEIHAKKAKYAGMFKPGKDYSKIVLNVSDSNSADAYSEYVYLHEYAHAIDHYCLSKSPELLARWVRLYLQSITPSVLAVEDARALFKPMKSSQSIGEWRKAVTEDQQPSIGLVLRHIKQSHKVTPSDLTKLMLDNDFATIKSFWPTKDIHSTELAPLITEYATTNTAETVAESLSYHMTGKKIPKAVTELVEDSIQFAIGQGA